MVVTPIILSRSHLRHVTQLTKDEQIERFNFFFNEFSVISKSLGAICQARQDGG